LHDWRELNAWWQPQHTEEEAVAVAQRQSMELGRLSPRRYAELSFVREPIFAAWVATLCPERELIESWRPALLETLGTMLTSGSITPSFFRPRPPGIGSRLEERDIRFRRALLSDILPRR